MINLKPFGEKNVLGSKISSASEGAITHKGVQSRRPDLRGARGKTLNIGEPTGVSLSYNPVIGHKFSNRPENELARIMPLYGGPPEDVIVNAWTKSGGKVMKEAYLDASKSIKGKYSDKYDLEKITSNEEWKEFLGNKNLETEFNQLLTKSLQKKGWKGIHYSPHRFDEFELKLFDPGDALVVDRRKMFNTRTQEQKSELSGLVNELGAGSVSWGDIEAQTAELVPKVNKLFNRIGFKSEGLYISGQTKTMREMAELTQSTGKHSLRDWYKELDVAKELGLRKGPVPEPSPAMIATEHGPMEFKKYKKMVDTEEEIPMNLIDEVLGVKEKGPGFFSKDYYLSTKEFKKLKHDYEASVSDINLVQAFMHEKGLASETKYEYIAGVFKEPELKFFNYIKKQTKD